MSQKKFKVATLGCRTNIYESEGYKAQLEKMGYVEGEDADLCIVNTCTVTASADSSSRNKIRKLRRENPGARIVVTGCLSDRVDTMPEVDLVVPNKKKEELISYLFPDEKDLPEFAIERYTAQTRAFIKIQDGCNSFCTYCIIPYVRGRSRSRSVDSIVREAQNLIANGYKEIVLTGINIGDFDGSGYTLAKLIQKLDQLEGLKRLRVSSIDPDEVDEALLKAIVQGKTTSHSMHIVLQSGSNAILKRMNRKYTKQMFFDTIARLKKASPTFTFTTDLIVGFPGESEEDHQESLEAIEKVGFAKVHMFPYSPRKRTRAALYPDPIAPDVIKRRKQEVLRLSETMAYDLRNAYVGKKMSVLIEEKTKQGTHLGHTDNFLLVEVEGECRPNEIVTAELTQNTPHALIGRV